MNRPCIFFRFRRGEIHRNSIVTITSQIEPQRTYGAPQVGCNGERHFQLLRVQRVRTSRRSGPPDVLRCRRRITAGRSNHGGAPAPRHPSCACRFPTQAPTPTFNHCSAALTGAFGAQELLTSLSDPGGGLLAYRTRVTDGFAALDRFVGARQGKAAYLYILCMIYVGESCI